MNIANKSHKTNPLLRGKLQSARVYPEFFSLSSTDSVINLGCGWGPQAITYDGRYRFMVGADINLQRLTSAKELLAKIDIQNYAMICSDVENTPFQSGTFDAAIAIDIIEHVLEPNKFLEESYRLLKPNGRLLITFPAMHDHFTHFVSTIARLAGRRRKARQSNSSWDPDAHNQNHSLKRWISLTESAGFELKRSRASTLFPPLHLYGVPRFWFTNNTIHRIDSYLAQQPILKNLGQALVCEFSKP